MRPMGETRWPWDDLREVGRDKERRQYGETSSDRESEGTSTEDSV